MDQLSNARAGALTAMDSPAVRLPRRGADAARQRGQVAVAPDPGLWQAVLGGQRLAQAELQALDQLAQTQVVATGHAVLNRAEFAASLVVLQRGEVALGLHGADGRFHTERIVRGPVWLDLSSAWLGATHVMDALALGPCCPSVR